MRYAVAVLAVVFVAVAAVRGSGPTHASTPILEEHSWLQGSWEFVDPPSVRWTISGHHLTVQPPATPRESLPKKQVGVLELDARRHPPWFTFTFPFPAKPYNAIYRRCGDMLQVCG